MTLTEATQTCIKKSFVIRGTASKSEFWYFSLFLFLSASTLIFFFASAAYAYQGNIEGTVLILPIFTFFALSLCVLPATISATIRRLHDIGKSGLYFFLSFIPALGTLILLYFLVQPTKEDSSYKEEDDDLL